MIIKSITLGNYRLYEGKNIKRSERILPTADIMPS